MTNRPITTLEVEQFRSLRSMGYTYRQIGRATGRSHEAARKLLAEPSRPRPSDEALLRAFQEHHTALGVSRALKAPLETTRRRLHRLGVSLRRGRPSR
jgi:hypothetical protein